MYSFNGNKIITTGAGGMLVSNHPDWAGHAKHLSTQAKADELQFYHDEVGYNYRLTNLQAALGLAQLEQLEGFIETSGPGGGSTATRWTAKRLPHSGLPGGVHPPEQVVLFALPGRRAARTGCGDCSP